MPRFVGACALHEAWDHNAISPSLPTNAISSGPGGIVHTPVTLHPTQFPATELAKATAVQVCPSTTTAGLRSYRPHLLSHLLSHSAGAMLFALTMRGSLRYVTLSLSKSPPPASVCVCVSINPTHPPPTPYRAARVSPNVPTPLSFSRPPTPRPAPLSKASLNHMLHNLCQDHAFLVEVLEARQLRHDAIAPR